MSVISLTLPNCASFLHDMILLGQHAGHYNFQSAFMIKSAVSALEWHYSKEDPKPKLDGDILSEYDAFQILKNAVSLSQTSGKAFNLDQAVNLFKIENFLNRTLKAPEPPSTPNNETSTSSKSKA